MAQRRPLALLALLAVSGRRGFSRDKIVALLWPESDAEHGRNSLSQVISLLRRELATDDIVLGTAELRVNSDVLACDVTEFEQRIAADDLEAATRLYTGPFLDGVFLKNTPEFERWVDQERSRLQHAQGDALESLATRATASGDHVSAVRFSRQRANLTPNDSRAALGLMRSLVDSGDPAGALAHYRVHQALLRDDLGLEPDASLAEFAAAVRAGNRRSAPNEDARDTAGTAPLDVADRMRAFETMSTPDRLVQAAGPKSLVRRSARWIVAAIVVLGLIAAGVLQRVTRSPEPRVSQLTYLLPNGTALHGTGTALSPDGTTIVYVATEGATESPQRLYVQRLDELHARPLAKTEGATYPFFSPDGASVGFFAGGRLKTVSLSDGSETVIADSLRLGTEEGADASWGDDGYVVFGENSDRPTLGISRVSAVGGPVQVLTRPDTASGDIAHFAPQRLPGTTTIIYSVGRRDASGLTFRVVAQELRGGPLRNVIEGATRARYIDGGQLVYQIAGDVFVARFDVRTLVLSERRPVRDGVSPMPRAQSWAATGDVLIYQPAVASARTLVWVSRDGTIEPISAPPHNYIYPAISPLGDRLAVIVQDDALRSDAWTYDLRQRSAPRKLSSDGMTRGPIIWSSDGKQLTYRHRIGTGFDLYSRAADGGGAAELLFGYGGMLWPAAWTLDMRTLVVQLHDTVTNGGDLWTLDVASKTLRPLVRSPAYEWGSRLSPDGRWLAYCSNVSGRHEVYVTSFPGARERWKVSQDGAREVVWSKDGRELFFRNGQELLVAAVRPGARFDWAPPRVLFKWDYWPSGTTGPGGTNYDVSSDGKRFLMVQEPPRGAPRLNVIQGWQRLKGENAVHNR